MGAKAELTPQIAGQIIERLANGESLRSIAGTNGIPSRPTIYGWLAEDKEFADQYARAREDQADTYADEIAAIADDETIPPDSRRIRIDARKWIACKLKPRKYGEKVTQELTGPGGGAIQVDEVKRVIVDPRNPDA